MEVLMLLEYGITGVWNYLSMELREYGVKGG